MLDSENTLGRPYTKFPLSNATGSVYIGSDYHQLVTLCIF